jgi:hypothetical protein
MVFTIDTKLSEPWPGEVSLLNKKVGLSLALSSYAGKSDKETRFMPRSRHRMFQKVYIQNKLFA